jgi:hypothetical protein
MEFEKEVSCFTLKFLQESGLQFGREQALEAEKRAAYKVIAILIERLGGEVKITDRELMAIRGACLKTDEVGENEIVVSYLDGSEAGRIIKTTEGM